MKLPNRLTKEVNPAGDTSEHAYDAVSNRIKLAYPGAMTTVYYEHDALRRPEVVWRTSWGWMGPEISPTYYTFDDAGNLTKKILANNCFTYYHYDAGNRVTKILNCLPDGSALAYFEYEFDAASRITSIRREDAKLIYYGYDNADRLASEKWYDSAFTNIYAFEWQYDGVGNRTYQKRNGENTYYFYDAGNALSRLWKEGVDSYFYYDVRGNCTRIQESDGTTYFEYTDADLVKEIKYKSGVMNYFYYDALLRRYAIQDSDGLSYFIWDQNGMNLLQERTASGTVTADYTHGHARPDGIGSFVEARKPSGMDTYFEYEAKRHNGDVVRKVNKAGQVTGYFDYNAWGERIYEQESGPTTRFRYQSNWIILKDSNGRFYLSPSRIYDAVDGTFLQRDPAAKDSLWKVSNRELGRGAISAFIPQIDGLTVSLDPISDSHVLKFKPAHLGNFYLYSYNPLIFLDPTGKQREQPAWRLWECPTGYHREHTGPPVPHDNDPPNETEFCSVPDSLVRLMGFVDRDHPMPRVDFRPACVRHDRCWRRCQPARNFRTERAACDQAFLDGMYRICADTAGLTPAERETCRKHARTYRRGVRLAWTRYLENQRRACTDCVPDLAGCPRGEEGVPV